MAEASSDLIKVIHVDDEPEFAEMAAEFIRRLDDRFDIATASSASEALEWLRENTVHCIVSDFDMPGQNGIEFLETVRSDHPELPFILYTGKGSEKVASDAISAGVTDYLQKGSGSTQYEVLANRIKNAVDQYRAQIAVEETEQRLQSITDDVLDATKVGIFILNANFEVAWCNAATENFFGIDRDNVEGREKRLVIEEDIADIFEEPDRFEELALASYDDNTSTERFECHVLQGDGRTERWLSHLSHPIESGSFEGGRVEIYTDITERKERERNLSTREETLRRLYEITVDETLTISEQIDALLSVIRKAIGTDYATFSHIQDDKYVFEAVDVAAEFDLDAGTSTELTELPICERVFETGEPLALSDVEAAAPGLVDPTWGISCYIGAPVLIDSDPYGTFCFYDVEPRAEPFADWEKTIVEFFGNWVGLQLTNGRGNRSRPENDVLVSMHDLGMLGYS